MVNRIRYFQSPEYQQALFSRSIMITGIHKANQSDLGLQQLLQNLRVPYPTTAVHIGRRVGELPELIVRECRRPAGCQRAAHPVFI